MAKYRKLLKNRDFVLYSIGQAFSQFGDRLVQIILIGFVYKRWPGSTFMLAKLFFFTIIPSFFISPVAGVYVDRWNKRYIMIVSDMFRAVAILFIPLFFIYGESAIPIYVIIFFIFAGACFFLPARLSIIPNLVSREDLLLANSASSITWVIAGIAGFSFGGILAEWIGLKNSFYVNALVYIFSATSFIFLAYSMRRRYGFSPWEPARKMEKRVQKNSSFFHDFLEGLKILFSDRKIKFVAVLFFIVSSMMGALYVVWVVFIQETFATMTKYVGLFSMYLCVGVLIGSYIYGKVGERLHRAKTIFTSLFLVGIFVDLFAIGIRVTGSFWFGALPVFLAGFFVSPIYVSANTIIHECTESNLRGRIFSSIGIVMNLGFILFMFMSSILAEHIDRFWILIACGSGFAVLGMISLLAGFLKGFTFFSSSLSSPREGPH